MRKELSPPIWELPPFGQQFKALRTREGLSQRRIAALLGVHDTTIARIEAGARKPPRNLSFYERLLTVPGFTKEDIVNDLFRTRNGPRWFDQAESENNENTIVSAGGFEYQVRLRTAPTGLPPEKIEQVGQLVKTEIELCLRDFTRRRSLFLKGFEDLQKK